MAKYRVHKTKDYTIMSNTHLKEKKMSLKAKGLLSVMLALPDEWNYSIEGLVSICKENETAIKSTLDEIKDFGYLTVTKLMPNETQSGRIEYVYDIYEIPKQEGEKQGIENLPLEFLPLENQGQLNTNELNTIYNINNNSNTKELKEKISKEFSDVVLRIFEYWNEKKIIPHRALTKEMSDAIEKALKKYTEQEIKTCIDRYHTIFSDSSYFWHYKWSLKDFLSRKDGISSFTDEGSKWNSYLEHKSKSNDNSSKSDTPKSEKRYGKYL